MSKPLRRAVGIHPSFRPAAPRSWRLTETMDHSIHCAACGLHEKCDCGTMPHALRSGQSGRPQSLRLFDALHARRRSHMDATAVVSTALTIDMNNFIKGALNGLSDADLAKRPNDQCNSIGWTLWHATRVEDGIIANISGKPQVWIEGGWQQKFDMPADPSKNGMG